MDETVTACGDGAQARALAEGADLVVAAQEMEGMDGLALVQALRAAGHAMPVILLSASSGSLYFGSRWLSPPPSGRCRAPKMGGGLSDGD